MGKVRVDGTANDLGVDGLEFGALVIELADLGRAHEGEIERPEEENDVLSLELLKAHGLELFLVPGLSREGWGGLADNCLLASLNHLSFCIYLKYYKFSKRIISVFLVRSILHHKYLHQLD